MSRFLSSKIELKIQKMLSKYKDWIFGDESDFAYSTSGKGGGMRFARSPTSGFSLLEILVVGVMVAILIVLLFPFMKSATAGSNSVRCASNLRQIGSGFQSYVADNAKFPYVEHGAYWFEGSDHPHSFFAGPYLQQAACDSRHRPSRSAAGGLFDCRSVGKKGGFSPEQWDGFDYAYNITLAGASPLTFSHPSRTILATEGGNWTRIKGKGVSSPQYSPGVSVNPGGVDWDWVGNSGQSIIFYSHNGFANFLFLDGHVEAKKSKDLNNEMFTGRF